MIHRLPFAALLLSTSLIAPGAFAQDAAPATPAAPAGPANLCKELVAFVKKPEEKKQEAATPASQSTAVSNSSGKSDAQPAAGGQPQQTSGLSGPPTAEAKAPDAKTSDAKTADAKVPTSDTRAPVSAGNTVVQQANAAAKVPPGPGAPAPSPKPDEALVAKIEVAAEANDQLTCRSAARTMRVAGVIMPPPLLALSALDPKFYTAAQP